ncbi:MAG: TonB-dependent receptor [Deltaproteobacteria bacterium]|nr:TonB-dependent receptor [Deltaproteobacteria bacterium]
MIGTPLFLHALLMMNGAAALEHEAPREATRGEKLVLKARFADGAVAILYRIDPEDAYTTADCDVKGDDWLCAIPAEAMKGAAVEYVIAGLDAARKPIALFGTPDAPHRVVMVEAGAGRGETTETQRNGDLREKKNAGRKKEGAILKRAVKSRFPRSAVKTVIDRDAIVHSGATNIPELLKRVAGVDAFSKTQNELGVGIRGTARDRTAAVLVLIDGQPVNNPAHGGVAWSELPVGLLDIERIEVVRGPMSHAYGADAMSGVIDIVTRGPDERVAELELTYGERGTQDYRLRAAWDFDGSRLVLSSGWKRTQNEKYFPAGTELQTDYTLQNVNRKDSFEGPSASVRWEKDFGSKATFDLFGALSWGRGGENWIPGETTIDDVDTFSLVHRARYRRTLSKGLELVFGESFAIANRQDLSVTNSGATETRAQRFALHGRRADVDVGVDWTSGANHLHVATTFSWRSVESVGDFSVLAGSATQNAYGGGVRLVDTIGVAKGFDLTGAFGVEYFSDVGAQIAPWVAANFMFGKSRVVLSGGMAYRRPDVIAQRYTESPNATTTYAGNSALNAERLQGVDLQFETRGFANHRFAVTAFGQIIQDLIEREASRDPQGVTTTTPVNRAKLEQVGGEVEFEGDPAPWIRYYANASVAFGRVTQSLASGSAGLFTATHNSRRSPNAKANVGVIAKWIPHLSGGLHVRYVSAFANYDELVQTLPTNDFRLDASYATAAWVQLDAVITGRIGKHVEIGLVGQNLLDRRHYDYPIYTKVGRKILATLRLAI